MLPKRIIALAVFAALTAMPTCMLRAQWVQTNGFFGGNIAALCTSGPNIIAASGSDIGSDSWFIYFSSNGGASWLSAPAIFDNISSMVSNGKYVFVSACGHNCDIYRLSEDGKQWDYTYFGSTATCMAVNGNALFVSSGDSVYRSDDNGYSWISINIGLPKSSNQYVNCGVTAFTTRGNYIYAGTGQCGIYRSSDNGDSWQNVSDSNIVKVECVGLTANNNYVFEGTYEDGVFVSSDDGSHWAAADSGLDGDNIQAIVAQDSDVYVSLNWSDSGLFHSTNNGVSWERRSNGMPWSGRVTSILPYNSNVFVGTDPGEHTGYGDGVYVSSNHGVSWTISDSGILASPFNQCSKLTTIDKNLFVGTTYGIFRSTDLGSNWKYLSFTDGPLLGAAGTILCANFFYGNGFEESTDYGDDWIRYYPTPGPVNSVIGIGSVLLIGTDSTGVFASFDSGAHWLSRSTGLFKPEVRYINTGHNQWYIDTVNIALTIRELEASDGNIFASTPAGVYLSSDTGLNWMLVDSSLTDIYTFASFDHSLLIGTSNALLRLRNAGQQIDTMLIPVPSSPVHAILVHDSVIFASTTRVVFSSDAGRTWDTNSSGLTLGFAAGNLAISDNDLFVSCGGLGVWRRPLSEMIPKSAVAEPAVIKSNFSTYPNPFSQSTTITFTPVSSGYADVLIVNLLGVEVARIFSGELAAGEHTFTWDARAGATGDGCATGMYECLIRMNGRVETQPVMLLR